jgi:predicted amidohydrolase
VQFFASYREKLPSAASADTSTGASMMAERAQKHKIFVTGGVIEEAQDGKIYNSMPVYGPDGRLVANYRKVHLSRYCRRILQRPVLLCAESELESARFEPHMAPFPEPKPMLSNILTPQNAGSWVSRRKAMFSSQGM